MAHLEFTISIERAQAVFTVLAEDSANKKRLLEHFIKHDHEYNAWERKFKELVELKDELDEFIGDVSTIRVSTVKTQNLNIVELLSRIEMMESFNKSLTLHASELTQRPLFQEIYFGFELKVPVEEDSDDLALHTTYKCIKWLFDFYASKLKNEVVKKHELTH